MNCNDCFDCPECKDCCDDCKFECCSQPETIDCCCLEVKLSGNRGNENLGPGHGGHQMSGYGGPGPGYGGVPYYNQQEGLPINQQPGVGMMMMQQQQYPGMHRMADPSQRGSMAFSQGGASGGGGFSASQMLHPPGTYQQSVGGSMMNSSMNNMGGMGASSGNMFQANTQQTTNA